MKIKYPYIELHSYSKPHTAKLINLHTVREISNELGEYALFKFIGGTDPMEYFVPKENYSEVVKIINKAVEDNENA